MSISDADLHETAPPPPVDDGSIRASVARLIASGKELAEAELAWARLKGAVIADGLRTWLAFAALALIFLMLGLTILVASAIIALAPLVGWLAASLIVAGASILAAILCALAARRTFTRLCDEDLL